MSIQITVRHSDGTTQNQTLNNGDGEIDTKTEAEDALALASKDGDTVDIGGKSYTRQQLFDIRDGKSGGAPKSSGDKSLDFSMSGSPNIGKWGHGTGAFDVTYGTLVKDGEKADVWAKIGGKFGGGLWNFETPGGEAATSGFYTAGLNGGVGVDFNPKGGKAHIDLSAEGSVSGFTSPKSTIVSLPPTCTPGPFGQGECEPNAGATEGDAGTSGLYNPDAHNSVHEAGVAISGALQVGVGVEAAPNTRLNVSVAPTLTYLADRHPFGLFGLNFGLGVTYTFGSAKGASESLSPVPGSEIIGSGDGLQILPPNGKEWPAGAEVYIDGVRHPEISVSGRNPIVIPYKLIPEGVPHDIEIRKPGGKPYAKVPSIFTKKPQSEMGTLPPGITLDMTNQNPSGLVGVPLQIATLRNSGPTAVEMLLTYPDYTTEKITIPAASGSNPGVARVTIPGEKTSVAGNSAAVLSSKSGFVRPIPYRIEAPAAPTPAPVVKPKPKGKPKPKKTPVKI